MSARRSNSARSCQSSSQVQVRPQTSRTQCGNGGGTWGCPRVNCTACCPTPKLPKCPLGVYVEKVQSLKPLSQYVPSDAKFNGLTTYRETYFPKCGARSLSFKPAAQFDPSDAKMDGLTTYRETYTPKCTIPYQKPPWAVAARFDPSQAKFVGVSTYRNDYVALRGELVKSMKPLSQFDPSDAPLDGKTTYRCAYIPFCPREYQYAKQPMIHKGQGGDYSCAPFAGVSTYRGDYWCKPIIKVKSMKPTIRGAFSDAPFADRTTYRNDYNPFHFTCMNEPCVPANIYNQVYPADMFCCEPDPPTGLEPEEPCPRGWVPPMRDCSDRPVGCCPACPDPVTSKTSLNAARACCNGGVCGEQQRMMEDLEQTLARNAVCGGGGGSRGGSQRGGSQRGGSQGGGSQRGGSDCGGSQNGGDDGGQGQCAGDEN